MDVSRSDREERQKWSVRTCELQDTLPNVLPIKVPGSNPGTGKNYFHPLQAKPNLTFIFFHLYWEKYDLQWWNSSLMIAATEQMKKVQL